MPALWFLVLQLAHLAVRAPQRLCGCLRHHLLHIQEAEGEKGGQTVLLQAFLYAGALAQWPCSNAGWISGSGCAGAWRRLLNTVPRWSKPMPAHIPLLLLFQLVTSCCVPRVPCSGRSCRQVALPESPPWWTLFSVALPQIYEVAAALHQLYRAPKPRFIPVCHQLLPSKPPTPASAAAPAEGAVDTGATPLPGRPGRPLDPSVRRTLGELSTRGVASTPGQVGVLCCMLVGCILHCCVSVSIHSVSILYLLFEKDVFAVRRCSWMHTGKCSTCDAMLACVVVCRVCKLLPPCA